MLTRRKLQRKIRRMKRMAVLVPTGLVLFGVCVKTNCFGLIKSKKEKKLNETLSRISERLEALEKRVSALEKL